MLGLPAKVKYVNVSNRPKRYFGHNALGELVEIFPDNPGRETAKEHAVLRDEEQTYWYNSSNPRKEK